MFNMSERCGLPIDRCVLGTVLLLALSGITAGITMLYTQGNSQHVLLLISCSGVISILMVIGMFLSNTWASRHLPSPQVGAPPALDLPPTYRNTWRLQYFSKTPRNVWMEMENTGELKNNSLSRGELMDTSPDIITGHDGATTTASVYIISEGHLSGTTEHRASEFGEQTRSYTVPADVHNAQINSQRQNIGVTIDSDEGLPRFEDLELG
nr:uncharacterized protein LOC128699456 [Cherax quadricarinatus]